MTTSPRPSSACCRRSRSLPVRSRLERTVQAGRARQDMSHKPVVGLWLDNSAERLHYERNAVKSEGRAARGVEGRHCMEFPMYVSPSGMTVWAPSVITIRMPAGLQALSSTCHSRACRGAGKGPRLRWRTSATPRQYTVRGGGGWRPRALITPRACAGAGEVVPNVGPEVVDAAPGGEPPMRPRPRTSQKL